MSLLKLPNEIIIEVATYLDWSEEDLYPTTGAVNLSVTCSQIRKALLGTVFKHVTLRLRWQAGALVEPCLFKLRL